MAKKDKGRELPVLTIDYGLLGTVSLDELKHALIEDLNILKEHFGVRYVRGMALKLPVTDAHGERTQVFYPNGGPPLYRMHTQHYRPACKDYDL
jgi:hypothetical protein